MALSKCMRSIGDNYMADTCSRCKYLKVMSTPDLGCETFACSNEDSEFFSKIMFHKNVSTCGKFESKDKPPLGVKPSCLTAESRISDLAEAILRYTEGGCTKHGYEQIKTFAKEIYLQSDLALQMEGENHVYQSRNL